MSEQINSKITKNAIMSLVALLSFCQFSQVFAGLKIDEDEVYIKDNITVVLTGYSIFTAELSDKTYTYSIGDKSIGLFRAQSHKEDTPLVVVVAPFFWDIDTTSSDNLDPLVTAVRYLGLPKIPLDPNKTDEWSINPGILDNPSNTQKMRSSGFYVKKTVADSAFVHSFGTTSTYVGFSNIRSNRLDQDLIVNLRLTSDYDIEYIKNGKSYANIKQGLSKLLTDNPDATKLHVFFTYITLFKALSETRTYSS
ncbi:MAG: hypothetical protein QS748_08385 [Candidatus Endonucleobacter bathymodioli]|uniref:Uncharacterized protein n=1 Tax=Candidatus Endonucleibacter bathymodioli TaxID=539814 RepID=A0AA90NM06_9GAMM|nr:hypothetical protein [Candidatus Endonucleobacter bathymodioli]